MKLYSLLVYDKTNQLTYSKHDLTDIPFIYRFIAIGTIENIATEALKSIEKGNLYIINETVEDIQIIIYGYCFEINVIVITDPEYPVYLVRQLLFNFKNPLVQLDELWDQYSNGKADKIQQTKAELEETKVVIMDSIDKLLERGEKISVLTKRAEELQQNSFVFANKARRMNRCCVII